MDGADWCWDLLIGRYCCYLLVELDLVFIGLSIAALSSSLLHICISLRNLLALGLLSVGLGNKASISLSCNFIRLPLHPILVNSLIKCARHSPARTLGKELHLLLLYVHILILRQTNSINRTLLIK